MTAIDAESSRRPRDFPAHIIGIAVTGVALIAAADPLAMALGSVLPFAAEVRSAGTSYPSFEAAYPSVLRGVGAAAVVSAAFGWALPRWNRAPLASRAALPVVTGLAAVTYGWLAWPHNAFPSNARIHWVDIFFDRSRDYFYTLVKLPHTLFYSHPWVLQALNGALNVALVGWLVARLTRRRWAGAAAALSLTWSGQMLRFADTAEDVQLSVTALLLVAVAFTLRRPAWTGLALFLAMLARPPFLLAVAAVVVAGIVADRRPATRGEHWLGRHRGTLTTLSVFGALFVAWHLWLHASGEPWLFADGRIISRPTLSLQAQTVDGYTIAPFDGAYIGHLGWLVPLPVWAAIAMVARRFRRLSADAARFAVFALTYVALALALNEALVMHYFNVRFLTYGFPLLLTVAWLVVTVTPPPRSGRGVAAGVALLALSTVAAPHVEFAVRERIVADPFAAAVAHTRDLQAASDNRSVVTTFTARGDLNYIAYLLRRPLADIDQFEGPPPAGTVTVTDDPTLVRGRTLYETPGLTITIVEE